MAALHVRAWQSAYRGILDDAYLDALPVAEWARRRRETLANPPSPETRWWVLERDGLLEGFGVTGPSRDPDVAAGVAELYAIYVEPAAVGTGLGRALLEHALGDLRARGVRGVRLWVFEDNARARRFYERAGFGLDHEGERTKTFGDTAAREVRYRLDGLGASPGPACS